MKKLNQLVVSSPYFEYFIIFLILLNAVILGMETDEYLHTNYQAWMDAGHQIILALFILEAFLKITAVAPRISRYFNNGWNLFDFSIIILSLIPFSAEYAMVARLFRLLRVLRLISVIPQLRLIVSTLLRSIPSMGNVLILLILLFYIYGIVGYHLFHEQLPGQWGSLSKILLTLFTIATLEGWADLLNECMQVTPWAWLYFVSFIVIATFVIINLFIAIVLDNMESAKRETMTFALDNRDQLLQEIEHIENQLISLKQLLIKR